MTPAPPASYPIFNTPPELANGIKATGWDVCDTASNHSLDQGQTGIDDTGKALERAHVRHTGSFPSAAAQRKLVLMDVKGVKVAFLAYTTDTNGIPAPHPWSVNIASAGRVLADAKRAKKMGARGGDRQPPLGRRDPPRYQQQPSSGQLALVKKLTASPLITAIVGQGPHAVQPIERINDKFVVFSEGNLISNQSPDAGLPAESQDGMVVLLHCVADGRGAGSRRATCPCSSTTPTTRSCRSATRWKRGGRCDPAARLLSADGERRREEQGIQPVPAKLPSG